MKEIGKDKTMAKRRDEFLKGRRSLFKKAYELSTLCNIPLCAIVYGPEDLIMDDASSSSSVETWPKNSDEVRKVIDLYRANKRCSRKVLDSDALQKRKCNTEQIKKATVNTRLQKRIDNLPDNVDELKGILNDLEVNIGILGMMIQAKKSEEAAMSKSSHHISGEASVPMMESPPSDNSQVISSNNFFMGNSPLVSMEDVSPTHINTNQAQGAAPTPIMMKKNDHMFYYPAMMMMPNYYVGAAPMQHSLIMPNHSKDDEPIQPSYARNMMMVPNYNVGAVPMQPSYAHNLIIPNYGLYAQPTQPSYARNMMMPAPQMPPRYAPNLIMSDYYTPMQPSDNFGRISTPFPPNL